jgi:hypothetical protein
MPFSIHPYRRFFVQCAVRYHAGLFHTLPLAYVVNFGALITLLVLNTGPAYAEWVKGAIPRAKVVILCGLIQKPFVPKGIW